MADDGGYPRFSESEMARRWDAAREEMQRSGADVLVAYGADRSGATLQWLSEWPVTREAALVWDGRDGSRPLLLVQFANHVDNAARIATRCEVRWAGPSTFETVAQVLAEGTKSGCRRLVGTTGPVPASGADVLRGRGAELVALDARVQRHRLVKSDEELSWTQRGAAMTDAALDAVCNAAGVGTSETELVAIAESAYVPFGGTTHIHYFCATSMAHPSARVPAQWPADRRLAAGDVVSCELSASWWGYPGQLLRTFTVGATPTPRYRALHEVAEEAFEALCAALRPGSTGADLREAGSLIERRGFSSCDDLVHGFVGGYFPPVVPGGGRPAMHDSFELAKNMTVVVQPNVVTRDGVAGVQTGELMVVTTGAPRSLHRFGRGMGALGT